MSTTNDSLDYAQPVPKLTTLLHLLVNNKGSDLHITTNTPPRMRIHGELKPLPDYDILSGVETKDYAYSVMSKKQQEQFELKHEMDLAFAIQGLCRFRVNVFDQRNGVGIVFRTIPFEIPTVDKLNLPLELTNLCNTPNGLVLVTGPTGSGKSTTLAALIDKINRERAVHILTIEDPIEFIHGHQKALVNQREIGPNTESFPAALRTALRQDPDIVLIGELRDLDTIESALRIAETGHLTFATLHTNTAASTITRIIDVFPANQQPQIRTQLSNVLAGVMCQQLLPKIDGTGRAMAIELLLPNAAVKNNIREDKVHQIKNVMGSGQEKHGMRILNQSLADLVVQGIVTFEEASLRSNDVQELQDKIGSIQETQRMHIPARNTARDNYSAN